MNPHITSFHGFLQKTALLLAFSNESALHPALFPSPQFVCQAMEGDLPCWVEPMHELSIMQSALSLALDQARQAGAVRVHLIRLRIGALSGVVPDALEFAFEALTPGTLAEGARLAIEPVPARFWCATCTREFQSDDMFAECPGCHNLSGDTPRRPGNGISLFGD